MEIVGKLKQYALRGKEIRSSFATLINGKFEKQ